MFRALVLDIVKLAEMEARVVGAETRAEIAEEKVYYTCLLTRSCLVWETLLG